MAFPEAPGWTRVLNATLLRFCPLESGPSGSPRKLPYRVPADTPRESVLSGHELVPEGHRPGPADPGSQRSSVRTATAAGVSALGVSHARGQHSQRTRGMSLQRLAHEPGELTGDLGGAGQKGHVRGGLSARLPSQGPDNLRLPHRGPCGAHPGVTLSGQPRVPAAALTPSAFPAGPRGKRRSPGSQRSKLMLMLFKGPSFRKRRVRGSEPQTPPESGFHRRACTAHTFVSNVTSRAPS